MFGISLRNSNFLKYERNGNIFIEIKIVNIKDIKAVNINDF